LNQSLEKYYSNVLNVYGHDEMLYDACHLWAWYCLRLRLVYYQGRMG